MVLTLPRLVRVHRRNVRKEEFVELGSKRKIGCRRGRRERFRSVKRRLETGCGGGWNSRTVLVRGGEGLGNG